jgi:hypothetical protein
LVACGCQRSCPASAGFRFSDGIHDAHMGSSGMKTAALIRAEEFARVAPVLGSCELVRGEIVTVSPGGARHGQLTARIAFLLE